MKDLICIECPNGCNLNIRKEGEQWFVSGYKCPKGKDFAISEMTTPLRSICSTVKTSFQKVPVLPVKASSDIPKDKIFEVMNEINKVIVSEKIGCGDIIIENVLDLGVNIVATSNILV
ncbi:MAG: DUF1667 domain-containing protein [Spirochaetales bacterium]|nr:DUF1667 domain-containing protein [Spirochaetales bacterium]